MSEIKIKTIKGFQEDGTSPEILFWVGCAGSFDDRAKKITKAFVKILNSANISFGVLGKDESCTGDPAKRAGNEFLFQMQAMTNIEVLNSSLKISERRERFLLLLFCKKLLFLSKQNAFYFNNTFYSN